MQNLIDKLKGLKDDNLMDTINNRIKVFQQFKTKSIKEIFIELCFCIMTANCGAKKCIEIHENIGKGFLKLSEEQLTEQFKLLGYRFPNVRSKYIIEARESIGDLKEKLDSDLEESELRDWIVKNIKGIGYKEGSHFLRNIGYCNLAIIDFHILDFLEKYKLIEKPKSLTKKEYLQTENVLKSIGDQLNLTLAELDLFLWYLETGLILK